VGTAERNQHRLTLAPAVLDVDGDGTMEALASLVHDTKAENWKLLVSDLKPAASTDKTHLAPFQPNTLYQSGSISFGKGLNMPKDVDFVPIAMITGHVPLLKKKKEKDAPPPLTKTHYKETELNDRNRHYFCGKDWHDASDKCGVPCPAGTSAECPDEEQCYADTPCDINDFEPEKSNTVEELVVGELLVSPVGGLPSVFSMWSNGVVAMHSLTGEIKEDAGAIKREKMKEMLGIKLMWEAPLFEESSFSPDEWTGVSLTYVDATDANDSGGMVVVQAQLTHYIDDDDSDAPEDNLIMAFDAQTGKKLWDVSRMEKDESAGEDTESLPIVHGTQSTARRLSGKPHLHSGKKNDQLVSNCLHAYRRSLLTSGTLPFLYFGEVDSTNTAMHFEKQEHNQHKLLSKHSHGKSRQKSSWKNALSPFGQKRGARHDKPKRGKPNVLVSKTENGLEVRSLKNGRSVCHVSLWYETLYSDFNHDGVLDGLFVVTGDHLIEDDDRYELREDAQWVSKIASRLKETQMLNSDASGDDGDRAMADKNQKLCHLMALSGVPIKEELFTVNLCGKNGLEGEHDGLDAAPLLAIEAAYGKGQDVVVALNNKSVQRIRGTNGRRVWQTKHNDFPEWDDSYITLLDRIEVPGVPPKARPIVLAGDNSVSLISPGHGSVLATATFPQPSVRRPMLVDFNGDGITDIVVVTNEAIWGYRVSVSTGSSIFFRIVVGLLVAGLMLAVLRNKFGPHPGKRSTDA